MNHNELVIVHGSDVLSMCEHHFVPFVGNACVGYIPNTVVLGLSKISRIVDFFSRRPQIQERLAAQIHATLANILGTEDVAVIIRAEHMCMRLRGVKQANAFTTTSKMSGKFMDKPALREEFLMLTRDK
jgi:GTP cyclohydrolase I